MALSIRWKILNWISADWLIELHFPKFTNSRGTFHSIKLKFRCQFMALSMGEWFRLFQVKWQAGLLCSLEIFKWFLGLNLKQNGDMSTSWLFIHHNSIDLIQTTTAAKRLFIIQLHFAEYKQRLRRVPSSETQGLLPGTMQYFRAEVYFKSWRAPGNLFLPNQFQKRSNSVPLIGQKNMSSSRITLFPSYTK